MYGFVYNDKELLQKFNSKLEKLLKKYYACIIISKILCAHSIFLYL